MSKKIAFSSPQPTGAIFSQFFVALKKCFEMSGNEVVCLEIDGDVSVLNSLNESRNEQIEVKEYSDDLTDSHKNFWNTINNWMRPEFNSNNYKNLILLTTQKLGDKTSLKAWNDSNSKERLKILEKIKASAQNRFKLKKSKDQKTNPSESLRLMTNILSVSNKSVLTNIIGKIVIDSNHSKRDDFIKEIMDVRLKNIPDENKQKVLNGLMGYIINTEDYNKGWEIKNNLFSKEFQDISEKYIRNSIVFPVNPEFKKASESEVSIANEYLFSKKIREIDYDSEVLVDAINDYWFTMKTILSEFKYRKSKLDSIKNYQDNLVKIYEPMHRSSSRSCTRVDLIKKSKDFYDKIMSKDSPTFDIYHSIDITFKNGIYHDLANEEKHNIHWKLKLDEND
ncbi:MAG: hypothetical protein ACKVIG_03220 [Flavobacteriales bacterium]|tara:strand:+ start:20073 stop:21254 length:1182 start_codon:yes stop_codon:yes gene_type:complete